MKDFSNIKGVITVCDIKNGEVIKKETYQNAFLDGGKDKALKDLMNNHYTNGFVAIGDGTKKVESSDTDLSNERFRKAVANVQMISKKIVVDIFVTQDEANFTWQEIGLVASDGTLTTLNSGTLMNRALIEEAKTNQISKSITWEIFMI